MLTSNRSNPALLCSPVCGQIEWKRWHSYVLLILMGPRQLFWKAFDFYSPGVGTCFMNFIVWRSKGGWRYSICSHIKLVRAQPQWAGGQEKAFHPVNRIFLSADMRLLTSTADPSLQGCSGIFMCLWGWECVFLWQGEHICMLMKYLSHLREDV